MSTLLFAVAVVALVAGVVLWAVARARRIRAEAQERENNAMAAMLGRRGGGRGAGGSRDVGVGDNGDADGDTIFGSLPPGRGAIDVAEVTEVVDLDALLAGESGTVARRARAQLEEPTNINVGRLDAASLQPARAPVLPLPSASSLAPPPASVSATPAASVSAAGLARAPGSAQAIPAPRTVGAATASLGAGLASAPPASVASSAAHVSAPAPALAPAQRPGVRPVAQPSGEVPLRELALAWFEARGYRSAPASPAVRPIELVLRHKDDPARAYAFVVESGRLTSERVRALRAQARAIGLVRLFVVAAGGAAAHAAEGIKGVRVMDRPAIDAEFRQLDLSVAAKIIAVARKRWAAGAAAAT